MLTERCADGASSVHERANWLAEYRPKYCLATADASAAVSGSVVLAVAADDAGAMLAAAGVLAEADEVDELAVEHAATGSSAAAIKVPLTIPFLLVDSLCLLAGRVI